MAASDVARRVAQTVRRHGPSAGVLLVREALWPASYRLCLFGLTPANALQLPPPPEGLEQHLVAGDEIAALHEEGWLADDCLKRLAAGDRCLVQRICGRVAGLGWMAMGTAIELGPGVRLRLPADAGYTYRSWTAPDVRGFALQAHRAHAFLRLVQDEGRGRLVLFVKDTKFDSLKGVRKAGYRPIGWIDVRERGGLAHWQLRLDDPAWSGLVPERGPGGQCPIAEDVPDPPRLSP